MEDVVARVPVSRRGLEVRFREVLGRSPAQEIRYARVEHARAMLIETNFSIKRIARAAKFGDEDLLSRAFR